VTSALMVPIARAGLDMTKQTAADLPIKSHRVVTRFPNAIKKADDTNTRR